MRTTDIREQAGTSRLVTTQADSRARATGAPAGRSSAPSTAVRGRVAARPAGAGVKRRPKMAALVAAPDTIDLGRRVTGQRPKGARNLVTLVPFTGVERLVKSTDRVRDLGEVFTPAATVQTMLDLLPEAVWVTHPSPTFLEPACGDGNFIAAILDRKLDAVSDDARNEAVSTAPVDLQVYALEALASIYGVDISHDNIIGGTPGHEIGARSRMLTLFADWFEDTTGSRWDATAPVARSAEWILEHNIQVGNMLATTPDGKPTGRDRLPLCEYTWEPADRLVTIATTTLGAVTQTAEERASGMATLFGPPAPQKVWTGPAHLLFQANATPAATSRARRTR